MDKTKDETLSLYNSHICRLCAEENPNGYQLFSAETDEPDLSVSINSYLPLKVTDDGKYPRWICPGCHLQVESTVQFFNLVASGQETLRNLYNSQCGDELRRGIEDAVMHDKGDREISEAYSSTGEDLPYSVELIQRMSGTITTVEANLEKPKRKRGRPPKPPPQIDPPVEDPKKEFNIEPEQEEDPQTTLSSGRRRRQIKIPSRYQEAVQGKELEKVYVETGVIEHSDFGSDIDEGLQEVTASGENCTVYPVEVIGHLQDNDGENLGDLVVINNKLQKIYKKAKKKTRFMCDICKVCFCYEQKFLQHRFSHHNVRFECTQCLENFQERNSLIQHQSETEHKGEGIIEGFEINPNSSGNTEEQVTGSTCDADKRTSSDPNLENPHQIAHYDEHQLEDVFKRIDELDGTEEVLNELPETSGDGAAHEADASFEETTNLIEELDSLNNVHEATDEAEVDNPASNMNLENPSEQLEISPDQQDMEEKSPKRLNYNCNICNHKFNRMQSYIYHKQSEHNDGRRFVCSKCKKSFKNKTLLQRHQLVHSNLRPFTCNYCDAAFKTKTHLFYHKKSHTGEKKHQCNVCDQLFAHKSSLTLHMRCHTGYKPFKCSVCGKAFIQHGNMQEHMRIHTGECPFECHICGRKFKTSSQVRMHIKRHEVNKPLKCNLCDKAFVQIVELRNHQRRHKNIKPYSCETCGKSFIDVGALKKHFRLHTGEKPYSCTECPRRFADGSNLKKHLKIHENKKQMEFLKTSNVTQMSLDQTLDEFTQSSTVSGDNFTLSNADVNSMVGENSMWDLIEEDACLEGTSGVTLSASDGVGGNQQLVNITYQDPDDPLRSKTTLFVVQNTPTVSAMGKISNIEDSMALTQSCNDDQLLQTSNVFLANNGTDPNAIQTVILNIQNPVDLALEQACALFPSDGGADNQLQIVANNQQKVEFLNYADALNIPD